MSQTILAQSMARSMLPLFELAFKIDFQHETNHTDAHVQMQSVYDYDYDIIFIEIKFFKLNFVFHTLKNGKTFNKSNSFYTIRKFLQ